jgi:hypothetical protein
MEVPKKITSLFGPIGVRRCRLATLFDSYSWIGISYSRTPFYGKDETLKAIGDLIAFKETEDPSHALQLMNDFGSRYQSVAYVRDSDGRTLVVNNRMFFVQK